MELKKVVTVSVVLILTGCATSGMLLTPAGAKVQVNAKKPTSSCTFIGTTTGRQNTLLSGTQSRFDLNKKAIADLQNNAAALGGNLVVTQGDTTNRMVNQVLPMPIVIAGDVYYCPN